MLKATVDVVVAKRGFATDFYDRGLGAAPERDPIADARFSCAPMPAHHPEAGPAHHPNPAPHKVLIVEDLVDTAHSLAELLELWGYEVRIAYDGQEAVELAQRFLPQYIVMDIGLPVMDGYQAATLIRADTRLHDVVLIALTGYGQEEDKRRAAGVGFNAHMTKPADLGRLHALLQ